uniref:Uncharacterized protein n=1 Tax=Heterorhabditis bacteriophora TaxID=37862 RepID=A0A1I7WF91_HETBA
MFQPYSSASHLAVNIVLNNFLVILLNRNMMIKYF